MNASQLISVHRPEQTQLVVLSDRAWHTLQWREREKKNFIIKYGMWIIPATTWM